MFILPKKGSLTVITEQNYKLLDIKYLTPISLGDFILTLSPLNTPILILKLFSWLTKSMILGMKWVLQMIGLKINTWVIFIHLKLWVAVARHNLKWVKF